VFHFQRSSVQPTNPVFGVLQLAKDHSTSRALRKLCFSSTQRSWNICQSRYLPRDIKFHCARSYTLIDIDEQCIVHDRIYYLLMVKDYVVQ
jgi:hypothetical protein